MSRRRSIRRTAVVFALLSLAYLTGCATAGASRGFDDPGNSPPPEDRLAVWRGELEGPCTQQIDVAGCEIRLCEEEDDMLACARLAQRLADGEFVTEDQERAYRLHEEACSGGVHWSCYAAVMARESTEWFSVHGEARLRDACELGVMAACEELGDVLTEAGDSEAGIAAWERACSGNDAQACNELGIAYERGVHVTEDLVRAADYYRRACELGRDDGCRNLALQLYHGEGVETDARRALELLEPLCRGGHRRSCDTLGSWFYDEDGPVLDLERGLEAYELGCQAGSQRSCTYLAFRLLRGDEAPEVVQDPERGLMLLREGCRSGRRTTCQDLAEWLEYEAGPVYDPSAAFEAHVHACGEGMPGSCARLIELQPPESTGAPFKLQRAFDAATSACFTHYLLAGCEWIYRAYEQELELDVDAEMAVWALSYACTYSARKRARESCRRLGQHALEHPGDPYVFVGLVIACHNDVAGSCTTATAYVATLEPGPGWRSTCETGNLIACVSDAARSPGEALKLELNDVRCKGALGAACLMLAIVLGTPSFGRANEALAATLMKRVCALDENETYCRSISRLWGDAAKASTLAYLRPLGMAALGGLCAQGNVDACNRLE